MTKWFSSKYFWMAIAILIITPVVVYFGGNATSVDDEKEEPSRASTKGVDLASGTNRTGIYFPLFAPPGPLWDNMLAYRNAHPSLPWIAVIDPLHGPGEQYDVDYDKNIKRLQGHDVTVLGYVSTKWASKSPDIVMQDIKKYNEWYDVDGILLDEMISDPGHEGLYYNYTAYAKSLGMSPVIGNVGTDISPTYVGTVDAICTVEGDRTPPLSRLKGWQQSYDKSNFLYITYSQSWIDPEYIAESTDYVNMLYITDDTMPFPYDDFPTYLDRVLAVLDPEGNNDLRTLSVRASDMLGENLDGVPVIVSPMPEDTKEGGFGNNGTSALRTPLAHVGTADSTYIVTAQSNSTHIFDHWEDGSTAPSREVTLHSSMILRPYYNTPAASSPDSTLVVNAFTTEGGQLGMWINVARGDTDSGSGLSPLTIKVQDAEIYTITANNHQHLVFDHWENQSTNRTRTVSINENSSDVYLAAFYRLEKDPTLVDLTVDAYTLDGTEIRGLWSVITPEGKEAIGGYTPFTHVAQSDLAYTIQAQDHGIYSFDHWEDGSTNRTRIVTPNSDTTVSAYYRTPSAKLHVNLVSTSNGELHEMSNATVTVTPLGGTDPQQIPHSMSYSGRLGSIYNVTATDYAGYVLDRWENGIASKSRSVLLSSDSTKVTAFYVPKK